MKRRLASILFGSLVLVAGCGDDTPSATGAGTGDTETGTEGETTAGDGDGDATGDGDGDPSTTGDGDGDPTGDGDGDPATGDGDGDPTGDGDGDPTGDGDGDPTGDGDGDPTTTGDGDGDPMMTGDGDGDPDPGPDDDMDGFGNNIDNCPDIPNPNQLDFDNDGQGNVCDVQVFTMGGGLLQTTATASAGAGSCDIVVDLDITGGEVLIQFDDDASVAGVEFVEFQFADTPVYDCQLAVLPPFVVVNATLSIQDGVITGTDGAFPTSVNHNQNDHDNGVLDGDQDAAHGIQITGVLNADTGEGPTPTDIDFPGQTPPGAVLVTNAGDDLELSFGDPDFIVLDETIMSMDLPVDVDLVMTGLEGTVTMTP